MNVGVVQRLTHTPGLLGPGLAFGAEISTEYRRSARLPLMAVPFAEEAVRLRDSGGLSTDLIARATGAAPTTVRDWLNRRSSPTGTRAERISELSAITERLQRVIGADYIPVWLTKPVEALDDEKPVDLIARGDYLQVARLISSIEDPGAV
jgi:transcriptional regulator with XRE-family HTH domain